jgi:hypothetical protein
MSKFEKIETAVYAVLWVCAIFIIFQDVISPREVEVKPAPATKLTARDVIRGVRHAANR